MGSIGGRKTLRVIENLERILAIELLCAAQAFDFRKPLRSSSFLEDVHDLIRQRIDFAEEDRIFSRDVEKAVQIIRDRSLLELSRSFHPSFSEFDDLYESY